MLTHARLLASLLPHYRPRMWQSSAEPMSADDAGAAPAPPAASTYGAARAALGRHEWRAAQRLLEVATSEDPASSARADLDAVRRARKALDRLARWPSSADAHLALGVACFELELGEDALREFREVQRLAPRRHEGFALAALEHAYRRAYAPALEAWTRARALNPELPPFADLLAHLSAPQPGIPGAGASDEARKHRDRPGGNGKVSGCLGRSPTPADRCPDRPGRARGAPTGGDQALSITRACPPSGAGIARRARGVDGPARLIVSRLPPLTMLASHHRANRTSPTSISECLPDQ